VALRDLTDLSAVLQAIDEYDELGQSQFLAKYGFGPSRSYRLMHNGQPYDLKAVLAAAHGYQFPDEGPLMPSKNFTSGLDTTVPKAQELGFEVDGETKLASTSNFSWIFQANPAYYDIANAVRTLAEMNWAVNQSKNQIAPGDHVYIWKSGSDGGVIADGHILTSPKVEATQEGVEFIKDPSRFPNDALRVRLTIDRVLAEPLRRADLLQHPTLKNLPILKFANATNFNITRAEDHALERLITDEQGVRLDDPSSPLQLVWWVNQGSHYREERDGGYLWAPLADRSGHPMRHWESLRRAKPGELVLNYANGRIRGVAVVEEEALEAPRPEELADAWEDNGLTLKVRYSELSESISLDDIPVAWRLDQGPPFDRKGAVQQKGYFFELKPSIVQLLAERFPQLGLRDVRGSSSSSDSYEEPAFDDIATSVRSAGMAITDELLKRYHLGLKTRGFVILSGVSGTGKTWLSRLYSDAIGATSLVVPVAPNWTTNEDLLGFQNPLTKDFQTTEFTRFLKRAADEWQASTEERRAAYPFHLILDEMNLAHVEYYFAKFLSAMETRATDGVGEIELAPGTEVLLPPNLLFVGTVNIDETTRGFADKVYDRAQLIELEVTREALENHLDGAVFADDLLAAWDSVHEIAPFAFRVTDEIGAYIAEAEKVGMTWETAFDQQLLQKVLPKVKGADVRIESTLRSLLDLADGRFPLTMRKVEMMSSGFAQHGFASYF
jgi:MoxR-like ATPase